MKGRPTGGIKHPGFVTVGVCVLVTVGVVV
jgi:hypothetical protein